MIGALFAVSSVITGVCSKPLDISVEAPWYQVSESTIALETVHKYNTSSYFPLLAVLLSHREKTGEIDTNAEVDLLFETAKSSNFLTDMSLGIAQQDFKLGSVVPNVEAEMNLFDEIAEDSFKNCPVAVWNEGVYTCDRTDLFALKTVSEPAVPKLFPSDHVIGSGEQWLVAYADFSHPEFADWHAVLLELALTGKASYVLRHRSPLNAETTSVKVAGYNVGVNLKRTDYLVVDDRQLDGEELKLDLNARNKVAASKIPLLGFGAVRKIRKMANDSTPREQLAALEEIMFNFPMHAPEIAASTSEEDLRGDLEDMSQFSFYGFNGLLLDGILAQSTDVNTFYNSLQFENNVVEILKAYLPNVTDIPEALSRGHAFDFHDSEIVQRYDLSVDANAIGWINDIEQDATYQHMSDDLDLITSTEGPFVPIRRNVHSVVFTGDLEDLETLKMLGSLLQQAGQQLPVQIGFVSESPMWSRICKLDKLARQAFIINLLRGMSFPEAEQEARQVHEDVDGKIQKVGNASKWLERFAVQELGPQSVFVNGVLLPISTWKEKAMDIFQSDADYLRSLENLPKKKSLRDLLFKVGIPKRNKVLQPHQGIEVSVWPVDSPIQALRNPEQHENVTRHSILLSTSFSTPESIDFADTILKQSTEKGDVDLFIRPLAGIDKKFYAALFDPSFNMFRFTRDLMAAAKGHLFQKKSAPQVFTAAKTPDIDAEKLPAEEDAIIVDGRYIRLQDIGSSFDQDFLENLMSRETERVQRLQENIPGISGIGIAAITAAGQQRVTISETDIPDIHIKAPKGSLRVVVVVDPTTVKGQELLALGSSAVKAGLDVSIFLSPSEIDSIPSKFFKPVFDRTSPSAVFEKLDEDTLYTAEVIDPAVWLTMAKECKYDLDNIVLNLVKEPRLEAVYSLHGLLIEGHARGNDAPGLQLDLYDAGNKKIADTMVMANLGYFQFQVPTPGEYKVCIPNPNFSFGITPAETVDCVDASLFSITGVKIQPIIVKQPPTNKTLKPKKRDSGLWGKLSGGSAGGEIAKRNADEEAEINIFTIASGHLYERFASIMMLSVMRHTDHTVKFWFIENFLSPKFKQFVPELASKYGFSYEFVSYKWPSWLRKQDEKQREIWGYKILFLDVIFPQTLSNIIFVDSDQIVRTDFQELLDIDLQGAPYAFTPMGDDRPEMEEFRFWKKGYWKKMLLDEGLSYHISALYRVDLNKLRKQNLGDVLRQQYQKLSADPSNLANLDQDLPNSLQRVVPIYSLTSDWLWCETWCGDEGLRTARTIDLCNNPLTKEPKLDRARRQIPEWVEYDNLVAELQAEVDLKHETAKTAKTAASQFGSVADEFPGNHPNEHKFEDDEDLHDEL